MDTFLNQTDWVLFKQRDKSSPFNSIAYITPYIPTKRRLYRDHMLCDVTSSYV